MGAADFWLFILVPAMMVVTTHGSIVFAGASATRIDPMRALRQE